MDRLVFRFVAALVFAVGITGAAAGAQQAQRPAAPNAANGRTPFALAPDDQVDLNLILAVDASGSVDDERFELQKEGYAQAFRNPKVMDAIRASDKQQIAVSMIQWTGPTLHVVMVPWIIVKDPVSADIVARAIVAAPRQIFGGGTSLSGAIDYCVTMFNGAPYRATRKVIDISGDGSNNLGRSVEQARNEAVASGVRINGLPILLLEHDLDQYYRESVIGGPGAFVIPVKNYDVFAEAILRKLITEISQDQKPGTKLGQAARAPIKLAAK